MTYSLREAGAEGPKAPNLLLLRETCGGSFFIPKDGNPIPAQLYSSGMSQPGWEEIPHKNEHYMASLVSQVIARLHHKEVSVLREAVLGMSGRVNEESHSSLDDGSLSKRVAVLHSELKCASLESCLERAGL